MAEAPAASVDLPATWLDLAGLKPAAPLAGKSLSQTLRTGKGSAEAAFSVWDDGSDTALTTRQIVEPYRLVRTRRHKYILWESRREALYDWQADPGEQRDLLAETGGRKIASGLRERLAARMRETSDHAMAWLGWT